MATIDPVRFSPNEMPLPARRCASFMAPRERPETCGRGSAKRKLTHLDEQKDISTEDDDDGRRTRPSKTVVRQHPACDPKSSSKHAIVIFGFQTGDASSTSDLQFAFEFGLIPFLSITDYMNKLLFRPNWRYVLVF